MRAFFRGRLAGFPPPIQRCPPCVLGGALLSPSRSDGCGCCFYIPATPLTLLTIGKGFTNTTAASAVVSSAAAIPAAKPFLYGNQVDLNCEWGIAVREKWSWGKTAWKKQKTLICRSSSNLYGWGATAMAVRVEPYGALLRRRSFGPGRLHWAGWVRWRKAFAWREVRVVRYSRKERKTQGKNS